MGIVSIVSVHFCFRHPVFFGTGRTVPHRVLLDLFEQILEIPYADRRRSHFFSRFFLVFCRTWNTPNDLPMGSFLLPRRLDVGQSMTSFKPQSRIAMFVRTLTNIRSSTGPPVRMPVARGRPSTFRQHRMTLRESVPWNRIKSIV